jgi:D-ribulokinase
VALPQTPEPVLLGASMLGAVAAGAYGSLGETMSAMSALGRLTESTAPGMAEFHRAKRAVYALLRGLDRASRTAMHGFELDAAQGERAKA